MEIEHILRSETHFRLEKAPRAEFIHTSILNTNNNRYWAYNGLDTCVSFKLPTSYCWENSFLMCSLL